MRWLLLLLTLGSLHEASWTWLVARQTPWARTNASYWQLVAGDPSEVKTHEAVYFPQHVTVVDRCRVVGEGGNVTLFDIADSRLGEQPVAGPSPLGNDPLSRSRLVRRAAENVDRRVVPWRVCGFQQPGGQVTFEAFWTNCTAITFRLTFDDGSAGALAERVRNERDGFELVHVCGYVADGAIMFVGVWHKSVLAAPRVTPSNAVAYNVSLAECQRLDGEYKANGSNLISFQVFNGPTGEVLCSAIWRNGVGRTVLLIGDSLTNITRAIEQADPQGDLHPSHISAFDRGAKIAVLFASNGRQLQCPVSPQNIWANVANAQIPRQSVVGSKTPSRVMTLAENRIGNFMRKHNIPSVAVALSSKEKLKLNMAFGYSKISENMPATPTTLYRIGDISKSFTSVAIFLLLEAKKLSLQDLVFGSGGILGTRFGARPYSAAIQAIRLRHLMEHTSGGWGQWSGDPIFLRPELNNSALIAFALDEIPLQNSPGTVWDFSHFGYLLLGAVIEQVSGKSYQQFVLDQVLVPCDIHDRMKVTAQWSSGRAVGEAMYYMGGGDLPVDVYDLSTPERMGPVAGWIASPADLLRFMARVDGSTIIADVLRPETLAEMYAASNASNGRHAKGWRVNQFGFNGLMHMGVYPGAKSLLIRTDLEVALALLMNRVGDSADFDADVIALAHSLTDVLQDWGTDDLFRDHAALPFTPPAFYALLSLSLLQLFFADVVNH
uniref:Beta-lactamase-related domain-containing protein n=1 Tax=Plectus sambesii TaxID=2011161 RepID=A0A914XQX5_9BILA